MICVTSDTVISTPRVQRLLDYINDTRGHAARDDSDYKKDSRVLPVANDSSAPPSSLAALVSSRVRPPFPSRPRQLYVWSAAAIDVSRLLWRASTVVWREHGWSLAGFPGETPARWRAKATGTRSISIRRLCAAVRQGCDGGRRIWNELPR